MHVFSSIYSIFNIKNEKLSGKRLINYTVLIGIQDNIQTAKYCHITCHIGLLAKQQIRNNSIRNRTVDICVSKTSASRNGEKNPSTTEYFIQILTKQRLEQFLLQSYFLCVCYCGTIEICVITTLTHMCTADAFQEKTGHFSLSIKLRLSHTQLLLCLKHEHKHTQVQ